MDKTITIQAGETVKIFTRRFSSVPIGYRFTARALDDGPLRGTVIVHGSRWLVRRPRVTRALESENIVTAGYWDTLFDVYVCANNGPLEVAVPLRRLGPLRRYVILALLVVVAAFAVFYMLS